VKFFDILTAVNGRWLLTTPPF